jgi:molecular chaperone GrpE
MMMKKKHRDHEETQLYDQNKTTENKENRNVPEYISALNRDSSDAVDSKNDNADIDAAVGSMADNVIHEVRAIEEKLAEMQDKYVRLSAEFDNYRKRTLKEKMDMSKYAGENLLLNLLPIMDDFERALKHIDSASDPNAVRNGIELIYGKLGEFLKQSGVRQIESVNSMFNVDLHEAVGKIPVNEEDKKGKVVDELLKGYYLQDKVLRFSKVIVGE